MKKIILPLIIISIVFALLVWLRPGVWIIIAVAFVLLTPSLVIFALIKLSRFHKGLSPETLHTRGMPLDILAPIYDIYCPKVGIGPAFRRTTLEYAGLKPGESVLDAGCGTGVLTMLVADAVGGGGRVVGIDPAAKMIEVAKRNAREGGSRAEFRLATIEELPFEDESFDCALSSLMLHHLPPDLKIKGLREVVRVLRPGGRIVLVDVGRPENPLIWVMVWPLLLWPFTKDQVAGRTGDFLAEAGFNNVERIGGWRQFLSFWKGFKT